MNTDFLQILICVTILCTKAVYYKYCHSRYEELSAQEKKRNIVKRRNDWANQLRYQAYVNDEKLQPGVLGNKEKGTVEKKIDH